MLDVILKDSSGRKIKNLTQWDRNQTIVIEGIEVAIVPVIYFSNVESETEIKVQSQLIDGNIHAKVPNELLAEPLAITASVDEIVGTSRRNIKMITIPVRARKPA